MTCYLYMEIEGIQRFVFAAPKLKAIRGGSAMLDLFNRVQMPETVKAQGGHVVFVGGGHCLANSLSRDAAEKVARELSRQLKNDTAGQVSLLWGIAEGDNQSWETVRTTYLANLQQRALTVSSAPPPLPPFVATCSLCGVGPATALFNMGERHPKPLCEACQQRLKNNKAAKDAKKETIWHRLYPHLKKEGYTHDIDTLRAQMPDREFKELAAPGTGAKYLAYLYCDGNGMGHALAKANSAEEYARLSNAVDTALHQAVAQAMMKHCNPDLNNGNFGAQVLMLGGDDLIVAMPGDKGSSFACTVIEAFHEKTDKKFRLSAGLVFAPSETPITILQRVAKDLLRSAKRYAYLDKARQQQASDNEHREPAVGYIDFQELASSEIDVERQYAVTCRPYRLDDFTQLIQRVSDVSASQVPRGRLHALSEGVHGSKREAYNIAQMVVGRAKEKSNDTLGNNMQSSPEGKSKSQKESLRNLMRLPFSDSSEPVRPYYNSDNLAIKMPVELYDDTHRWSPIPDAIELIDNLGGKETVQ